MLDNYCDVCGAPGQSADVSKEPSDIAEAPRAGREGRPARRPTIERQAPGGAGVFLTPDAVANIIRDQAKKERVRKTRSYKKGFVVDEQDLNEIEERFRRALRDSTPLSREIRLRYSDGGSETYRTWKEVTQGISLDSPVESMRVTWEAQDLLTGAASASVSFITERPLDSEPFAPRDPEIAHVTIEVVGPDVQWTGSCFDSIARGVKQIGIPAIFRPLEVFRNGVFRTGLAVVFGALTYFAAAKALDRLLIQNSREERLAQILAQPDISARFEAYLRDMYLGQVPFWWSLLVYVLPLSLLVVANVFLPDWLAYMVPSSSINIGPVSRQFAKRAAAARVAVFYFLIPLLVTLLGSFIFKYVGG